MMNRSVFKKALEKIPFHKGAKQSQKIPKLSRPKLGLRGLVSRVTSMTHLIDLSWPPKLEQLASDVIANSRYSFESRFKGDGVDCPYNGHHGI